MTAGAVVRSNNPSMDQTIITPIKGNLAMARLFGDNPVCQVDPSLSPSTPLLPGQAVKLLDDGTGSSASGLMITPAAPGEDIFGFVINNLKRKNVYANEMIDIAIAGSIMWMEAATALTRGLRVGINTSLQVVDATSGVYGTLNQIGQVWDKALTEGDLVRVYIMTPGLLII